MGDLAEGFQRRAAEDPVGARRWYRWQVVRSLPGAVTMSVRTMRDSRVEGTKGMETLRQDLRFAFRSLRKSPGFAVVATVTLALAIGVNTSIFSIISAIVFADLPMQDHETSVMIRGVNPELGIEQGSVSPADFLDLRERARSYSSLSALTEAGWVLTGQDRPERVEGILMTPGTTESWRLPPVLGRAFTEDEGASGGESVVMLTHGFWQSRFDGDPDVLGRSLILDGQEHTVVGVMSPTFEFASFRNAEVIAPLTFDGAAASRSDRTLFVTGRLASGVSQEMATQEVARIGADLAEEHPAVNAGWSLRSAAAMDSLINSNGRRMMLLLQLTVGMVILIACANVANMLLARATSRSREMAVRTALGAGRGRLVRQLLTESVLISLVAAGLGLGVAYGLNEALLWISAGAEEAFRMAEIDGKVLAFTLVVSLVAPMAFGLFPALRASGSASAGTLRDGRSGTGGASGSRARGALVTAQVSLALTLMIVAGLLARSVVELNRSSLGYELENLLTVRVDLPANRYADASDNARFFQTAEEELEALPSFQRVTLVSSLPGIEPGAQRAVEIEGVELVEGRSAPSARFIAVGPGLFETLGLRMVGGRGFTEADDAASVPVAVVSSAVADRFWEGQDPVGRRLRPSGSDAWIQVVGVVENVGRGREIDDRGSAPNIYRPYAQDRRGGMYLVGRTAGEASAAAAPVREALWSVDADLPIGPLRTIERAEYERSGANYAIVTLFGIFALFALVMAAVGIYGVMAYSVSSRKTEIGVRMALGAETGGVRAMILRQGAKLMAAGVVIGLGLALLLSRVLESMVFGISATDPATFVGVTLLLGLVALVANLVPAARATRMDPARTLREG